MNLLQDLGLSKLNDQGGVLQTKKIGADCGEGNQDAVREKINSTKTFD